jgi:hypothetical protein
LKKLVQVVDTLNPVDQIQLTTFLRYLIQHLQTGQSDKRNILMAMHLLLYSLLRYHNLKDAMEVIPDINFDAHPFMFPDNDENEKG